jgi:hypothetical protein
MTRRFCAQRQRRLRGTACWRPLLNVSFRTPIEKLSGKLHLPESGQRSGDRADRARGTQPA